MTFPVAKRGPSGWTTVSLPPDQQIGAPNGAGSPHGFKIGRDLMKTLFAAFAGALLLTVPPSPAIGQAQTIAGSAHDFRAEAWAGASGGAGGDFCSVCHTPHAGDLSAGSVAPLWNHAVTDETFTPYVGVAIDADGGTIGQPNGVSKLCLSCHDGVTALDSYGGITGSNILSGGEAIGTNLQDDHPVSMTYNDALATTDGALAMPSTALSGLGGTIAADLLFGSSQVECASCHDVHNNIPTGVGKLLRKDNTQDALCVTCHTKGRTNARRRIAKKVGCVRGSGRRGRSAVLRTGTLTGP